MSSLPAGPATVLVVAPPTLQRQGLLATLRDARPDLPLTITADAHTLPDRLRRAVPTLLILDAGLAGDALGALIGQARAANPQTRVLVVGGKKLPFAIARLVVEQGAGMLLARHATPGELVAAVAQLVGSAPPQGFDVEEPRRSYNAGTPVEAEAFTNRELEVLQLIAADCSSQEIADRLFISVRTVETHRRTLLGKTGARSVVGLILHAMRNGWVSMA